MFAYFCCRRNDENLYVTLHDWDLFYDSYNTISEHN